MNTNYNFKKTLKLFSLFALLMTFSQISSAFEGDSLKIDFPRDTMDFGTMKEGDILNFSFKITNRYNNLLIVNQVYASCGCTTIENDTFELKPGETREIKGEFDSEGRVGNNFRWLRVFTSEGLFDVFFKVTVTKE